MLTFSEKGLIVSQTFPPHNSNKQIFLYCLGIIQIKKTLTYLLKEVSVFMIFLKKVR